MTNPQAATVDAEQPADSVWLHGVWCPTHETFSTCYGWHCDRCGLAMNPLGDVPLYRPSDGAIATYCGQQCADGAAISDQVTA